MNSALQFVLARLKERSTWLGLVAFATALGVGITPEQGEAIAGAGLALAGLIGVFTKDKA